MNQLAPFQDKSRLRASGPGYSLTAASKLIPMPRKRLQRAVDRGEVQMVEFGGVNVLTAKEIERIRSIYGIEKSEL